MAFINGILSFAGETDARWWPKQTLPKGLIRVTNQQQFPEPRLARQMMIQSVAGLAAKAVNEGRGDELVWVDNGEGDLENWCARMLAAHPEIDKRGTLTLWESVDRYKEKGIIQGYILYRRDTSKGEINSYRPGMDCAVNIATSLAGLMDGIIVDEELEKEAKTHGLKLLADVRGKSQQWCFNTYKDRFFRRMLCTQDPRKPHIRDLAIAHKAFTVYGGEEPVRAVMEWLEPLSPILGWNGGDEFATTDLSTSFGHIQTATDWCMNLPVLMAGADDHIYPKIKAFNPRTIDWGDTRSGVCFVSTDGDNVQWMQGNFFSNSSYWGNSERGRIPYGWSCCFDQLAQLCPQVIDYAVRTQKPNDSFIEWGGGYYFPDRFGQLRSNRWELLSIHARRTWELMKRTGTRVVGFNFSQIDSADARKASETFASQTDGLLAILAFQYAPYEAGAGKIYWVKDRNRNDVPVITARYAIWEHANNRERAGTPAKIAREIRQTVERTPSGQLPRYDWVIDHVWSYFKRTPGADENAEDMVQQDAQLKGGERGYLPTLWSAKRLPTSIRTLCPEELIWRIRMKHDPVQTQKWIESLP